jgi:hypothetical protein
MRKTPPKLIENNDSNGPQEEEKTIDLPTTPPTQAPLT